MATTPRYGGGGGNSSVEGREKIKRGGGGGRGGCITKPQTNHLTPAQVAWGVPPARVAWGVPPARVAWGVPVTVQPSREIPSPLIPSAPIPSAPPLERLVTRRQAANKATNNLHKRLGPSVGHEVPLREIPRSIRNKGMIKQGNIAKMQANMATNRLHATLGGGGGRIKYKVPKKFLSTYDSRYWKVVPRDDQAKIAGGKKHLNGGGGGNITPLTLRLKPVTVPEKKNLSNYEGSFRPAGSGMSEGDFFLQQERLEEAILNKATEEAIKSHGGRNLYVGPGGRGGDLTKKTAQGKKQSALESGVANLRKSTQGKPLRLTPEEKKALYRALRPRVH